MKETKDYSHIKGWGIDADPENEPTYPLKNYTGDDHARTHWDRPSLQVKDVEILHSNERPTISAVFGNTLPPKGLSGIVRRLAFRYSENRYRHWLPLLLADRIDVIEGLFDDLRRGHIPNIFAEKGYKARWKHDRNGVIKKAATVVVITSCLILLLRHGKNKR